MTWQMIFDALTPSAWFYAGHCWSYAVRRRPRFVVLPVDRVITIKREIERLPPAFAAFDQDLAAVVFDARMAGPGMTTQRKAIMSKNGGKVLVHLTCDTDQFAAPEKDNRR